jgi:hypothetical protein
MFLNRFPRAFAERRGRASLNSELRFRLISRQSGRKERVSMMTGLGNHPCENKNLLSWRVCWKREICSDFSGYVPTNYACS